MVPREGERGKGRSTDSLGVCSAGRGRFSAGRGVRQKWNLTVGLLFPSIRFLKIVVDPSSLCCGEKQFQGVIHPAWKRYSVNPVLAVPGSLDSNGTQTLNSRFPGEGGTNPIPGGRFVLQSVMDVSEILSLTSSRARGGGCGKVRGYLRTMLWDTEGPPGIREGQSPICALYIPGASLGSGIIWILRP